MRLAEENSKTLMGIVCTVFLLGMFLLCGIEDSLKQPCMKKEATDRRLQVCFSEAEVSTAHLSKGEVSNPCVLSSASGAEDMEVRRNPETLAKISF